jgi:hypothetical protein
LPGFAHRVVHTLVAAADDTFGQFCNCWPQSW